MKERDIRDRINAFLRNRLQNLVVPASMGLGLALGACNTSALTSNLDGSGDSSAIQPSSGGAGGGLTGAGGSLYGLGGSTSPGHGGSGGSAGAGGAAGGAGGAAGAGGGLAGASGTAYGLGGSTSPRSGGAGGGLTGAGGTVYGTGGFPYPSSGGAGGGLAGAGGTVYGMPGFKDAGPDSPDTMISEAGVVEPTDAKKTSLPEAPGE